MKENIQPVTGCGAGDTAPYIFLSGDPDRIPKITASWQDVREVCRLREYVIQTGTCEGVEMTAASTGIGGPSTGAVMEELAKLGGHTFIRIGNSGALAEDIELGDYVITTASIRDEGTSRSYVRTDYPAAAHYEVTAALASAAEASGNPWHSGVTWSVDGFYSRNKVLGGDGELISMCCGGYEQSGMNEMLLDMKAARVKNIEMESSTILTLAALFGLRAGCICTVSDRAPWPGPGQDSISINKNIEGAIQIALTAMLSMAQQNDS